MTRLGTWPKNCLKVDLDLKYYKAIYKHFVKKHYNFKTRAHYLEERIFISEDEILGM